MSKYTVELRYLLNPLTSGFTIGLLDYPIFDEAYRAALNEKIIKHFFFREVGASPPAKFKYFLNRTMDEIMPLYNQMYKSQLIEFDPLRSYDLTETSTKDTKGSSTGSGTSSGAVTTNDASLAKGDQTADNLSVNQDTPQKNISRSDLGANLYASSAIHDDNKIHSENSSASVGVQENTSTGESTANVTNLDEYTHRVFGNIRYKDQSELLMDFRKTFLNIDAMILNDLDSCFMQIW